MPELPEVETMRRGLRAYLLGKVIEDIEVRLPKIVQGNTHDLLSRQVVEVRRYGKGLVIDLTDNFSITAHVKMTGQFIYRGEETLKNFHPNLGVIGQLPNKWTHVIFTLQDKEKTDNKKSFLFYNDIRQFGWLKIVKTDQVSLQPFFKDLGPEPFADLTFPIFEKILSRSQTPIKVLLMDQRKIAGVGNIYANDALFKAKINPTRSSSRLDEEERHLLYEALLEVLQKGIDYGGASEINYINVEGEKGGYQNHFLVYGKQGKACLGCGTTIQRIKQAGRSTFYCPHCQK